MNRTVISRALMGCSAFALGLAGLASDAQAQQSTEGGVETVVVTASKRSEPLSQTPVAITALTEATLKQLGIVDFSDYANYVPGLTFNSLGNAGHNMVILRGLYTGFATSSSTVGYYVDDIPIGGSASGALPGRYNPDPELIDVDRVEVLKGPQGTLYGSSTLGGLIKIVTKQPDLNTYSGEARAEVNTIDDGGTGYGLSGSVNIPIVDDKVGVRVMLFDRSNGGYINDVHVDQNSLPSAQNVNSSWQWGGRATMLGQLSSDLTLTVSGFYEKMYSNDTGVEDVNPNTLAPLYGSLTQSRYLSEPEATKTAYVYGTFKWTPGPVSVTETTSYSTFDDAYISDGTLNYGGLVFGSTADGVLLDLEDHLKKFTEELRVESPSTGSFQWLAGVYYDHEDHAYDEWVLGVQNPGTFTHLNAPVVSFPFNNLFVGPLNGTYEEVSGYGDATYYVTQDLDATVGFRYSENTQFRYDPRWGLLAGATHLTPATEIATTTSSSDSSPTYLATVRWRPTDTINTYARVASGWRPGGGSAASPGSSAPDTFAPDNIWDYELGSKATWLDGKLYTDADVYYISWNKIQVNTLQGGFLVLGNGGTALSKGFEASVTYVPIDGLSLTANTAFTDAYLTQNAPGIPAAKGDALPMTPLWSGALMADYTAAIWGDWAWSAGGSFKYQGPRYTAFSLEVDNPRRMLPSYGVVDLRAALDHGPYALQFRILNAFDSHGISGFYINRVLPSQTSLPGSATIIQPRTFSLAFTASF